MKYTPLVSIVITSFNRLEDVKETIKRSGDIPYLNKEIIVVDGGSTDGTVEYLQSLEKEGKHKMVIIGENLGNCYTTNEGMKSAVGEFVFIIDDDCFLRPKTVQKTVDLFHSNPNLAAIGFGLKNPNINFSEEDYWKETDYEVKENQFNDSYQTMNYGSASAYRRSVLIEVDFFDTSWDWSTGGEDNELNFKIIAHGYNSVLIPELVAYHKISPATRDSDTFIVNCIHSTIWLILKFYPGSLLLKNLFVMYYNCMYFSILYKKTLYMKGITRSLKNASVMLSYKHRMSYDVALGVHLPIKWLFSHDRELESTTASS